MHHLTNLLNQVQLFTEYSEYKKHQSGALFNMFRICGVNHYENTHSSILAELFNPEGTHGLQDRFLNAFIETLKEESILEEDFHFSMHKVQVKREFHTSKGRIDILIQNGHQQALIIENKIYAKDQEEQLKRYYEYSTEQYTNGFQLLYLTLEGDDSEEASQQAIPYKKLSYKDTILTWIDRCIAIAARKPIVRETLIQYSNHLKSLTNTNIDTEMDEQFYQLLAKEENITSVFNIANNINGLKNYILNNIFLDQLEGLCEKMELELVTHKGVEFTKRKYIGFIIRNPGWKYFRIFFEFQNTELRHLVSGIGVNAKIVETDEVWHSFEELTKDLKTHSLRCQNNLKKRVFNYNSNFDPYSNWDAEAMKAIINGNMVEAFKERIEFYLDITKDIEGL